MNCSKNPFSLESIIQPILKSQNKENCYNYRGVSLISCIGKLFTIILCNWISVWAASTKLLPEEQFGFRKGRHISDAIFVLHTLAESQIFNKRKLYSCFVDLQKAFDTVAHSLLWSRRVAMQLHPHMIHLLQSDYTRSTACEKPSGEIKFLFYKKGVKQGCNLSPLLFSRFK